MDDLYELDQGYEYFGIHSYNLHINHVCEALFNEREPFRHIEYFREDKTMLSVKYDQWTTQVWLFLRVHHHQQHCNNIVLIGLPFCNLS